MNYQQACDFLVSLNNIPHQEYLKDKKKSNIYLKRTQFLLDILGNPEKQIPHYIHVTGTSGKGSISLMLDSILRTSGKKVGLNVSPAPSVITERWTINGRTVSKKDFAELVEQIRPALQKYLETSPYDFPSFFEIVTTLGLMYFAKNKIEWAIVEVGLGGRNDSTNIIPKKDLAVITNIGEDHLDLIGPTKKEVAYEKAGIIQHCPTAITAETDLELLKIIQKESGRQKAKLTILPPEKNITILKNYDLQKPWTQFVYKGQKYIIKALGIHQINNAILAIESAQILGIKTSQIQSGLQKAHFPVCMEIVSKDPFVILDGAHNPDKMKTTIETIKSLKQLNNFSVSQFLNLHLIIGFSADKDIPKMLKQLATLNPTTIFTTRSTSNPFRKTADPVVLAKMLAKIAPKAKIKPYLEPQIALQEAKKQTKAGDLILVTGSIFLSGELRV